ncbi:MAG TPA: Gp37 family protein [Polyangiaceae bacterium]|nr:Gp37 family protein [Polyangiaceae bacterium]
MTSRMPDDPLCLAVIGRLKAKMPKFQADHFPDDPDAFPWAKKEQSLFVGYDGSSFSDAESLDPISQSEDVRFAVTVVCRGLRGAFSVDDALKQVRRALLGWRPRRLVQENPLPAPKVVQLTGHGPCLLNSVQFIKQDQGIWIYAVQFRVATVVVSDSTDDEIADPDVSGGRYGDQSERSTDIEDPDPPEEEP